MTTGVYRDSITVGISEIDRRIQRVTEESRETLWLKLMIGLSVKLDKALCIFTAVRTEHIAWVN